MEVRLRHICRYPFQVSKQDSLLALAYTCLAGPETAEALEIATHGYRRLLNDANQELLVLVVRDTSLQEQQVDPVLHVPFQILRQFSDPHPKILLTRQPLAMHSALLPALPQASEVNFYFNSSFEVEPVLLEALTRSSFVFRTGNYYLELHWFKAPIQSITNLRWKLRLSEEIAKQGRTTPYMRVYVEAVGEDPNDHFLFKRGFSKANIKTKAQHPFNLYSTISLDRTEKEIFELEPYKHLGKRLRGLRHQNAVVLLQAERDAGVGEFLQSWSQGQLSLNYHCLDCRELSSSQQFWRQMAWIVNLESSLVLVQGLDWLLDLHAAEMQLGVQIRQIAARIEREFKTLTEKTLRNYVLVLEHRPGFLTQDMFQNSIALQLQIDKALRSYICKSIFDHFESSQALREDLVQLCSDKLGWQAFKTFMKTQWPALRSQPRQQILKQASKLAPREAAENLIEVSWDDVGGLESAKEEIVQTILLPVRHPEIFDSWIRPRTGLLFYGPPGTGKTLLGKCIAKECGMSFISVKGPELLNMYVGESEKNVRSVFERAAACRPCIVFMDELDALVPKRGNGGDSHQVMDRIVAELMLQMDLAPQQQVFVIGATNRPDLLDPSILRPGRFDKQIYLGITSSEDDRLKILKAQTRHLTLAPDLDWTRLLAQLPPNLTGADFYGLTSKAAMAAAERTIEQFQAGRATETVQVREEDFLRAAEQVRPSVSEADLARYEQLKKVYS